MGKYGREDIIKKWVESGLILDGLHLMDDNKPMLKVMKSVKKHIINEPNNINELNMDNIGGYLHFYIVDGNLKRKIIPPNLKDAFLERFGSNLLNTTESELNEFMSNI